jgi:hypothetical protein
VSLLIDELADWLEEQELGVVGETIFKIRRPPAPVECISLHATGGYAPDRYTAREHPTVMVQTRSATPDGALRVAYQLFAQLHRQQGMDLGDLHALTIEAAGSPAYVGTEQAAEQTAHIASLNLHFDLRQASS